MCSNVEVINFYCADEVCLLTSQGADKLQHPRATSPTSVSVSFTKEENLRGSEETECSEGCEACIKLTLYQPMTRICVMSSHSP